MTSKNLYNQILKQHKTPDAEAKRLMAKVDGVISKINSGLKQNKIKADVVLGGSAAKGTFLKGDFDVDVFVRFDSKYKKENLSLLLEKAIKKLKPEKVHGSRDYFHLEDNKLQFEIIPVLKIKKAEQAENVTDMSPFHVKWVEKHLNKKLKDEILLAKLFCKARRVYGAESYIQGFSGHVLDILVINYGSFEKLLKAAVAWPIKKVIDVEKHYKNEKEVIKKLNISKLVSPLIIVDPVDRNRNAAAALSLRNYKRFRKAAALFIKNPCEKFFVKEKITPAKLKKRANGFDVFIFNVKALKGKEDVIGSKIMKAFNYMKKQIELNDFNILEADWIFDKKENALLWFILKKETLSEKKEHMGPPIKAKSAVKAFKTKHKKAYERKNRLWAKVKRKFRKSKDCIKYLAKTDYVEEKVKSIKIYK